MTFRAREADAMAFGRNKWVSKVRDSLSGALREYAKQRYGELIDFDYSWEKEIKSLIRDVEKLFDPKIVSVKFSDLDKAFREAFIEAALSNAKVSYARNQFESNYLANEPERIKKFLRLAGKNHSKFEARRLLVEMLEEYSPALSKRLR